MPISNQQAVFRGRFRPIRATLLGLTAAQAIFAGSAHGGPTTLWNLDRIDQRDQPIDGRFCPVDDGSNVNVYVVSTGVLDNHDEFWPAGRASCFYVVPSVGTNCQDVGGRGTWLASIVGGTTHGVARGARIHSVRVAATGSWTPTALRSGLAHIRNNGSLPGVVLIDGVTGADPLVDAEVTLLVNDGFVVVAGAGDDNANACNYSPARVSDAITVSATDVTDDRTNLGGPLFGNYGTCVDLFAPGVDIAGAWLPGPSDFNTVPGVSTAAAAAHVAGAAALLLDANPGLSPAAVRSWITNDATSGVVSDPGSGSPNLLLYVQPGTCDPCPIPIGPDTITYKIVGPANGVDWSWCIRSTDGSFADISGTVAGVSSGGSHGVALAFANSIITQATAAGCDVVDATATQIGSSSNGRLEIDMGGTTNFILEVGPAGTPCGDPAMCQVGPTDGSCSFNPTIEQIVASGADCNANGFDDAEDIAFGVSPDVDGNGIPDECEPGPCAADLDGSGDVGFADLTALLSAWGPCGAGPCPADLDGNGDVGFTDLTALLGLWGPCA